MTNPASDRNRTTTERETVGVTRFELNHEAPPSSPRCACYHIVTPRECMALRYGYDLKHDGTDETCECSCHDAWYEEQEDFYAEQSR